jgi:soluble lytic murein transglycosylase
LVVPLLALWHPPQNHQAAWTSPSDTSQALLTLLRQQENELRTLRGKLRDLEAVDDGEFYEEADALGILKVVAKCDLPDRQKRRLAVAIVREARRNRLDPLLVVALIQMESSFDNYAKSSVGAMGLMQVMPATGKSLAAQRGSKLGRANNLFDAELNIEFGTAYLASLIGRFRSVEAALVAYNAGPGLARRILADRAARKRFLAGYPAHVLREFQRLKAEAPVRLAER